MEYVYSAALIIAAALGYIINVFKLAELHWEMSAMLILRILGVINPVIGAVVGWI